MKKYLLLFALVICMLSCTENQKAKNYGGTAHITLEPGKKLVNVTWKETNLWYLVRDMLPTDSVQTYEFKEKSDYGIWQGTYIITETR